MEKEKNRITAACLTMVLGLGHLYLKNYRGFIVFFSVWMLLIASIISFITCADFFYQGPLPWSNTFVCMFIICPLVTLFALLIFSGVETDYQCDLRGLVRNSLMDTPIKNYRLAYRLSLHIPYIIVIVISGLTLLIDGFSYFAAEYLVGWTIICVVGTVFIQKYRNIKIVNSNVPETQDVREARLKWEAKSPAEKRHYIIKFIFIVLVLSAPFIILRIVFLTKYS